MQLPASEGLVPQLLVRDPSPSTNAELAALAAREALPDFTTLVTDGLSISGVPAWVVGTLIVWLISALGGWALGLIFLKNRAENRS